MRGGGGPAPMRWAVSPSAAAFAAGVFLLAACARPAPEADRRHVLLVTVDTLRPDYLSGGGTPMPTSPFLDALLAGGIVFRNAVTPTPRTTQALASLHTGLYPHTHGVRTLTDSLGTAFPVLAERAREAGWATIAVVSNHILTPRRGLGRGFDVYDFAPDSRDAAGTTRAALDRLAELAPEDSVLLWVHYIDPHVPYYPPPELAAVFDPAYRGRFRRHFGQEAGGVGDRAFPANLSKKDAVFRNELPDEINAHVRKLYAADVRATDDAIRRLVRGLEERLGDDWVIVFSADHGESLGEHDYFFDHGDYVYDPGIRVPLAFVFPPGDALRRAAAMDDRVSLVDVAPTLAELLGLTTAAGAAAGPEEGRSLVPLLRGEPAPAMPVFAESGKAYFPGLVRRQRFDLAGRLRTVIDGGWKLVRTPGETAEADEFELFDLAADPGETRDLYHPSHPAAIRLQALLGEWTRDAASPEGAPDDADLEALRALGYVE